MIRANFKGIVLGPVYPEVSRIKNKYHKEFRRFQSTFGYYDIFTKIQGESSSQLDEIITKKIRNIPNVTTTTTLSIIPDQDFEK